MEEIDVECSSSRAVTFSRSLPTLGIFFISGSYGFSCTRIMTAR